MVAWTFLVIARQTPLFHQPAKAALNDPASRQHDEALLVFGFLDDDKPKTHAITKESAHALHELLKFAGIPTVGEDHQQPHEAVAKHAQTQPGSIAILNAGGRDHRAEQQSVGVGEHMALSPLDLFARVVTTAQSRKLPSIQVYYDVGNMQKEGEDYAAAIRRLGRERICETHAKDYADLYGKGSTDFIAVRDALRDIAYTGWMHIEGVKVPNGIEQDIGYDLRYLRGVFD